MGATLSSACSSPQRSTGWGVCHPSPTSSGHFSNSRHAGGRASPGMWLHALMSLFAPPEQIFHGQGHRRRCFNYIDTDICLLRKVSDREYHLGSPQEKHSSRDAQQSAPQEGQRQSPLRTFPPFGSSPGFRPSDASNWRLSRVFCFARAFETSKDQF